MAKQLDNVCRNYEIRASNWVTKPFLYFFTKRVITGDKSELIKATTRQRVEITKSILETLEGTLGRKVEIAGISGKDLSDALSFSKIDIRRTDNFIDFRLMDNEKAIVGSLTYAFPDAESGDYSGKYFVNGGVNLNVLGSAIRDETQYNALQIGLRKVKSA